MEIRKVAALRHENPRQLAELLAGKAVKRGIKWLNKYAPVGWHRNLFEPLTGSHSHFRCRTSENISSPLALAFEHCPEFAEPATGYVNQVIIMEQFGLRPHNTQMMGFNAGFGRYEYITSQVLDKAWKHALENLNMPSVPRRHDVLQLKRAA